MRVGAIIFALYPKLQGVGLKTPKLTIFSPTQKLLIRLYYH
ncbi:hypothetical protein HMPREF1420_00354 [Helicobacter pylori GAM264Ai]|uniref:Uncharacterized protein n=1 Tax=Helicobacter pylori GAM260BSi TaxID=1159046 RepID=M3QYE4_HELPX|nr:hypothetical protein HMPREF1403_00166 [Helicobacter pylori GAM201Ai]EMH25456.1 hypothetical protein HMPREF1418_00285 [Helicobacter pylori GAM260BSi]EMH26232.1 hypothetical protein HMPREF1420_00354 [Helicobacter pylori GAM264Ai]